MNLILIIVPEGLPYTKENQDIGENVNAKSNPQQ